ncbi:HNH endonuclease [Salmonella enterica]|nr:HNH endonuclease [Salmonella enterica]EEW9935483.1 HNH endonuclease [Salmonella enterica]EFT4013286.1 HNH endonuclease [Salmonella enterica]EGM4607950.1 HNH endonuclease [Salmonella enterica]EKJ9484296.1 HNH endonuclease [Salmonella enterica]
MNWIDIPGCAGFYQAHPNGVIRSTDRKVRDENNGKILSVKGRELKPQINRRGYLTVSICINGQRKQVPIHRLIAKTFLSCDTPDAMDVDHINGIRTDNRATNLRWLKRYQNCSNKHACKSKTNVVGVTFYAGKHKPWRAYGSNNGRYTHLGYFASLNEAAAARRKHIQEVMNA